MRTAREYIDANQKYFILDIHDELKSRLNLGNACYYSVQNLFVFLSYIKKI